jgi:RHS repeat-associated protein
MTSQQSGFGSMSYQYNLAGGLTSFTFPSGRQQTFPTFDAANRPTQTASGSTTYAKNVAYWPNGTVQAMTTPAAFPLQETCQNVLLQTVAIRVGASGSSMLGNCANPSPISGDTLFLGLTFGSAGANNGNLTQQQIHTQVGSTGGLNLIQNYTYDYYNRLSSMWEVNGWQQTNTYDQYGNRAVSQTIPNPDLTPVVLTEYKANNQWQPGKGYTYDAVGNQLTTGSRASLDVVANSFSYDAENRLTSANIGNTGTVSYVYDGEGRRVQKTVGSVVTQYVYDSGGALVAETTNQAATVLGTEYLAADHLGSTRLVMNGSVLKRYDYLPFGEEIPQGVGGRGTDYGIMATAPGSPDVVSEKFTGQLRDGEMESSAMQGLDYFGARYYGSGLGRFTSADEGFADQHGPDPQSWNLYTYVRNNPLGNVDLTGHDCIGATAGLQTAQSCVDQLVGGLKAIGNIPSSIVNLPNTITNLLISPLTDYRLPDWVPNTFSPSNTDQSQGMESMNAVIAVSPVAELAAESAATSMTGLSTSQKVDAVHGALMKGAAQDKRTTAILETDQGTFAGGGARDLSPAQRGVARGLGAIPVKAIGEHGEITVMKAAIRRGATPEVFETSRPFCSECHQFLKAAGATIESATRAVFKLPMSILTFDHDQLLAQISRLTPSCKLALCAASAEPLIGFYEQFWHLRGEGPSAFRKYLDAIWDYLEKGPDQSGPAAEEMLTTAQRNVPDEDEIPADSYAQESALAVTYALDVWVTSRNDMVLACLEQCYNVADNFVLNTTVLTDMISEDDELAVLAHPVVQAELARQQRDLTRCRNLVDGQWEGLVASLRAEAKAARSVPGRRL